MSTPGNNARNWRSSVSAMLQPTLSQSLDRNRTGSQPTDEPERLLRPTTERLQSRFSSDIGQRDVDDRNEVLTEACGRRACCPADTQLPVREPGEVVPPGQQDGF